MRKRLSVRDQNNFISAFKTLFNEKDDQIYSKNVNTLYKFLENYETAVVSQLLMSKMANDYSKDPDILKNTFSKLFDKVIYKKNRGHKSQKAKLQNILQQLESVVMQLNHKQLHENDISPRIDMISTEIISDNKNITNNKKIISFCRREIIKLKKELAQIEHIIKTTTAEQFAKLDAMYKKKLETKINQLTSDYQAKIDNIRLNIDLLNKENIAFISLPNKNDADRQSHIPLKLYQERISELETEITSMQNSQRQNLLIIESEKQQSPEQMLHNMIIEINIDIAAHTRKISLASKEIANYRKSIESKSAQKSFLLGK